MDTVTLDGRTYRFDRAVREDVPALVALLRDDVLGTGLGRAMFAWAHAWGRARGAILAQLTTDASRTDAQRFYERLGYEASHIGMKRPL
ncbi:GNAT family N-acetyltransferase [Allobranchiibius sp. GilTou73]|uniref:GNAT family N-acetyltransferase n=1 Tax=Allobranchiibius sp. GilTou73 TaxID=2904523 RepID=UPI001F2469B8|nr:GNAT family N-acetyltransferase [Allobranchiibius sp. GilTou73]UIJ35532.1 hypothetical protein LVQ62_03835 [Allobranchiibius sp. GilTou73]